VVELPPHPTPENIANDKNPAKSMAAKKFLSMMSPLFNENIYRIFFVNVGDPTSRPCGKSINLKTFFYRLVTKRNHSGPHMKSSQEEKTS
jgi:hypothetical protein